MERIFEEMKVMGKDLVDRVRALIHEGNVQRLIIKDDRGNTFMEIPVSIAALGTIAAPLLAAIAALAGMIARFTVVVERAKENPQTGEPPDNM
jgi:Domain of unknown function (DUF4342)